VSGLRIAANRTPTAASTIRANCTATTFVFIEQAAAAPAAQGRGGRNQRNSRQR
jgi:hypothetical protein